MTTEEKSQLRLAGEFILYLFEHPALLILLWAGAVMWLMTLPNRLGDHGWEALNPKTSINRQSERNEKVVEEIDK